MMRAKRIPNKYNNSNYNQTILLTPNYLGNEIFMVLIKSNVMK